MSELTLSIIATRKGNNKVDYTVAIQDSETGITFSHLQAKLDKLLAITPDFPRRFLLRGNEIFKWQIPENWLPVFNILWFLAKFEKFHINSDYIAEAGKGVSFSHIVNFQTQLNMKSSEFDVLLDYIENEIIIKSPG